MVPKTDGSEDRWFRRPMVPKTDGSEDRWFRRPMVPKTDGSEDRWFRRQKLYTSKVLGGNDLQSCDAQPAADWECAKRHSSQKTSLDVSVENDKLDALIETWPRLSEALQSAIIAILDSLELGLRKQDPPPSEPSRRETSPEELNQLEQLAHFLAHRCRSIIQSCFREEEWIDIDQEFFTVILEGMRKHSSTNGPPLSIAGSIGS